jgi:hypothetical protein
MVAGKFRAAGPVILFILFVSAAGFPLFPEVRTTVELEVYNTLSMTNKEEIAFSAAGVGTLSFTAAAENVKGELELKGIISETPLVSLSRGFIKTRFPWFRLTLGKAAVSWGNGFAFNAGDVIFRRFTPSGQLSDEVLRDMSIMLTSVYIPFGPFSFAEILVLPPELDIAALVSDPAYTAPPASDTRLGGRTYLETGPVLIEPGYLYDGALDTHFLYLSMKGYLFLDWHVSSSLGIETRQPEGERIYKTFLLSPGVSWTASFAGGGSLTLRTESLIYPAGAWKEDNSGPAGAEETAGANFASQDRLLAPYPEYGILLYPEISWGITESAAVFVRSVFSPIDMSALTSIGGSWNIFTGFDLLGFISIEGGGETDTYAYGRPGWFSVTAGGKYIF